MYPHVLPFLLSWLLLAAQPTRATNTTANIAAVTNSSFFVSKPGCPLKCGNVTVPYPFGIGSDCSIGPWFNIACDNSSGHPKPYIGYNTIEVLILSISQTQVWTPILFTYQCYNQAGGVTTQNWFGLDAVLFYTPTPYSLSVTANKVTVVGCNDIAVLVAADIGEISGCSPSCWGSWDFTTNCNGLGCCQSDVPKGLEVINLDITPMLNHSEVWIFVFLLLDNKHLKKKITKKIYLLGTLSLTSTPILSATKNLAVILIYKLDP